MRHAKILLTVLLVAIFMVQPVLACCLVHADSTQQDEAPEAPPCHGDFEATSSTNPEAESDHCSSLGDCGLTSISHPNPELKTISGTIDPEAVGDHIALQSFGAFRATSPPIALSKQTDVKSFVHQTPISLKERLLI